MTAYALFDNVKVHDAALLGEYAQGAAVTVEQYGGRYLAVAPPPEPLEGDQHLAAPVLIEFPDLQTARRWYESEDYAPWKALRQRACENTAILFEGLPNE